MGSIDLLLPIAAADAVGLPFGGRYAENLQTLEPLTQRARDFTLNDWTDDTDLTVCVGRAIIETGGEEDFEMNVAARIAQWVRIGIPKLGDQYGQGCGGHLSRVTKDPGYDRDPLGTAAHHSYMSAGNGSLKRTALTALMPRELELAARQGRVTHSDPRCVGSCVLLDEILRHMPRFPAPVTDAAVLRPAFLRARPAFAEHWKVATTWFRKCQRLDDLELDSRDNRSFVLKTATVAIWAVQRLHKCNADTVPADFFRDSVVHLVRRGGDADTNAVVAAAVWGKYFGAKCVPADWANKLPHIEWLYEVLDCGADPAPN